MDGPPSPGAHRAFVLERIERVFREDLRSLVIFRSCQVFYTHITPPFPHSDGHATISFHLVLTLSPTVPSMMVEQVSCVEDGGVQGGGVDAQLIAK